MIACTETRELVESKQRHRKPTSNERREGAIYIKSAKEAPACKKPAKQKAASPLIQLTPEAVEVINNLAMVTGQSKRYLCSQLVLQGAKIITFYPAACDGCIKRLTCNYTQ